MRSFSFILIAFAVACGGNQKTETTTAPRQSPMVARPGPILELTPVAPGAAQKQTRYQLDDLGLVVHLPDETWEFERDTSEKSPFHFHVYKLKGAASCSWFVKKADETPEATAKDLESTFLQSGVTMRKSTEKRDAPERWAFEFGTKINDVDVVVSITLMVHPATDTLVVGAFCLSPEELYDRIGKDFEKNITTLEPLQTTP